MLSASNWFLMCFAIVSSVFTRLTDTDMIDLCITFQMRHLISVCLFLMRVIRVIFFTSILHSPTPCNTTGVLTLDHTHRLRPVWHYITLELPLIRLQSQDL